MSMQCVFWKPNKKNTGCGIIFDFNNGNVWLQLMPQKENELQAFDSEKSIKAKLGLLDLSSMLAVIFHRIGGVGQFKDGKFGGLYHANPNNKNNTSIIKFERNNEYNNFYLGLQVKRDGESFSLGTGIQDTEIEQLRIFIEWSISELLKKPVER